MCKIRLFCILPKGFVRVRLHIYIARARGGLRVLSNCAGYVKTKGFLMNSATEPALASVYKRSFSSDK